jgi:hypothetical protein
MLGQMLLIRSEHTSSDECVSFPRDPSQAAATSQNFEMVVRLRIRAEISGWSCPNITFVERVYVELNYKLSLSFNINLM